MNQSTNKRQVLIVSSHPLFGKGIQHMLETRQSGDVQVIGMVSTVEDAIAFVEAKNPDLVVVDYDDSDVNRDEFLAHFVGGERKMRVVLFSLQEGGSNAIVYDRRTMLASQVDDWLEEWVQQEGTNIFTGKTKDDKKLVKKKEDRNNPMKHLIGAILFVIVLAALGMFVLSPEHLLPIEASLQAEKIDWLFNLHFKTIAVLFALIIGFMLYSVVFFRKKKGDTEDAVYFKENSTLEITWTVIPLIVVIGFAFIGSGVLADTVRMDPKALEVKVTGQQWSWSFEYPDQQVTTTELVLPVNKQVLLRLTSLDVIHSFWVPEFRVKQDAIPGGIRELRVTPNKIGDYQMVCSELCGRQHAYMTAPVRVLSQEDFDAWIASSQIPTDPVGRGNYWYKTQGCASCHSLDGTKIVGPSFKGLFGSTVTLTDGSTVVADENYIHESIIDPYAKIVEGFELSPGSGTSAMPSNFGERLSDEQISEIIEFIKTLK